MKRALRMEELEERIAPTVITAGNSLSFTDSNGDEITVEYDGIDGSQVEVLDTLGGDIDNGDDIGTITFTGANLVSALSITSDGAGGNDLVIDGGISAPGQDVGYINLGWMEGEDPDTDVVLGSGFAVNVGGDLGAVFLDGHFDCDTAGHSISAGGDIGTILIGGRLHLDSGTGLADIDAGTAGDGDISFLYAEGLFTGTGTGSPVAGTPFTATATIADDVGDGTIGTLTLKLSGVAAAGEYWAVPVVGGGNVLAAVQIASPNSSLAVTASRAGGDVSVISFTSGANSVTVSGTADTDVLYVVAEDSVGSIVNKTSYGDIGLVDIAGGGHPGGGQLGLLQTGKTGVLGSVFTGLRNEIPIFYSYEMGGTVVVGTIDRIQAGAIMDTQIWAGSFGSINVNPGQIIYTDIMTAGDIGQISAQSIFRTTIGADGEMGKLSVGSGGITDAYVSTLGGIGSVAVKGLIVDSLISTHDTDIGGSPVGAGIGSISAAAIIDTEIEAMGDIGNVKVKGAVWGTNVTTRFWDTPSSTYKGGSVVNFSAGGMYDSDIYTHTGVGRVKVGKGGMLNGSEVYTNGSLGSLQVAGDFDSGDVRAFDGIGTVKISGSMSNGASIFTVMMNSITVSGALWDSEVDVLGDVTKASFGSMMGDDAYFGAGDVQTLTVSGCVAGDGETIIDVSSFNTMTVKGDVYWADIRFRDGGKLTLSRGAAYVEIEGRDLDQFSSGNLVDFALDIEDDLDLMRVNGSLMYTDIAVEGEAGLLRVNGDVIDTDIRLYGPTAAGVSIKGDVYYTDITVGQSGVLATDTGTLSIGGSVLNSDFNVYGPVDKIAIKGNWFESDLNAEDVVGQLTVGRSMNNAEIDSDAALGPISIGGNLNYADIYVNGGLGNVTIKGNLMGTDIMAENYDGSGDPIAADIANITAAKIYDTDIVATGNIGMINVQTVIADTFISSAARDNYGAGTEVSGGTIAGIKAAGLIDTAIDSWGDLGKITLGNYGLIGGSAISVLDSDADFLGLTTKGLITGEINLAGDLTGSILTGGADAIVYDGVYLFTDANGTYTDGIMFIDGAVAPGVVIS